MEMSAAMRKVVENAFKWREEGDKRKVEDLVGVRRRGANEGILARRLSKNGKAYLARGALGGDS